MKINALPYGHVLAASLIWAGLAHAELTDVAHYRLGAGGPNTSVSESVDDEAGSYPLTKKGNLTYTSDNPTGQAGARSILFDGSGSLSREGVPLPDGLKENYGISLWAMATTDDGESQAIIWAGGRYNGFAILRRGGSYQAFLPGKVMLGAIKKNVGEWTHLALVNDGGTFRFFVDGKQISTSTETPNNIKPTSPLFLGANPEDKDPFTGAISDVRFFTFGPGDFSPDDLKATP